MQINCLLLSRYAAILLFSLEFISVPAQPRVKPFANSHFLTVDSVMFHYRSWNDDLPHPKGKVLLIHGFAGSTFCWRKAFDTLVHSGFKVIAIDMPGFGYSGRNANINQSQSNRARLVWACLDRIDRGDTSRWNIVGHSMGGGAVEAMALIRPERVRTLIIVDGLLFVQNKNMEGAFITAARSMPSNHILVSFAKKNMLTYHTIRRGIRQIYGSEPDSADVMGYLTPLLIEGSAASVISVWANSKEVEHLHLEDIRKMPVLLIWGKKDRTIPLRYGRRFLKVVPEATLKIIPGAYHSPMETHPDIFNPILLDFLLKNN